MNLSWQAVVEKTVTGLGYEVVGCERSAGGLLRVYIDKPLVNGQEPAQPVNVEDCERVTRQLRYVMEVEEVDYRRLEVSTPGLDRPLNHAGDYARFRGHEVEITLREAFQGRKKYKGVLAAAEGVADDALAANTSWRVIFSDGKTEQALDFALDEVRSAKLVPEIVFKNRASGTASGAAAGKAAAAKKNTGLAPGSESADGGAAKPKASKKKSNAKSRQTDDKVDGGLDQ
ncbi:ribosome maturation factor RimP [Mitsuaria sp. GD03876]|uniref:ribosome maturation factor RimP n=1 Tax=Mitsuaria sp. GD03876 TaxID=2975399 RepID=UPI0032650D66